MSIKLAIIPIVISSIPFVARPWLQKAMTEEELKKAKQDNPGLCGEEGCDKWIEVIKKTIKGCNEKGIPISLCGKLAGKIQSFQNELKEVRQQLGESGQRQMRQHFQNTENVKRMTAKATAGAVIYQVTSALKQMEDMVESLSKGIVPDSFEIKPCEAECNDQAKGEAIGTEFIHSLSSENSQGNGSGNKKNKLEAVRALVDKLKTDDDDDLLTAAFILDEISPDILPTLNPTIYKKKEGKQTGTKFDSEVLKEDKNKKQLKYFIEGMKKGIHETKVT